jgi:hypothetical protein
MNNVNVEQLDKITWEAIGNKLEGEQYTTKKRAVQEFFKVSKHYQRYRNGEYGRLRRLLDHGHSHLYFV